MGFDRWLQLVFIFYFTTVGLLLILAPWTPGWDLMLIKLPFPASQLLGYPLVRGALSGFGLVHLVWGVHDAVRPLDHADQNTDS